VIPLWQWRRFYLTHRRWPWDLAHWWRTTRMEMRRGTTDLSFVDVVKVVYGGVKIRDLVQHNNALLDLLRKTPCKDFSST
jgi:hypothetical protein